MRYTETLDEFRYPSVNGYVRRNRVLAHYGYRFTLAGSWSTIALVFVGAKHGDEGLLRDINAAKLLHFRLALLLLI